MSISVWVRSGIFILLEHIQLRLPHQQKRKCWWVSSGKNALSTCTRTSTTVASALSTSASAPSHSSHCHIIMFPRHVSFLSVPIQYVHILYFRISFVSEHPSAPAIHRYRAIYCTQPYSPEWLLLPAQDWRLLLLLLLLTVTANVLSAPTECLGYSVSMQMSVTESLCTLLTCHSHEPGRFRWMLKVQRGKCNVPDWIMWTFKNPVKNCVTETSPNARFNPKTPFQQAYNLILSWYSAQSCVSRTPGCPHYPPWTFGLREQKSKLTIFSSILRFFIILWFSTQKSLESRTKRNQLFI